MNVNFDFYDPKNYVKHQFHVKFPVTWMGT